METLDTKKRHDDRMEKNPDRANYAIKRFEDHDIKYELKNEETGHFHVWRMSDNQLFQFWAGTGKILGHDKRGIDNLINELLS